MVFISFLCECVFFFLPHRKNHGNRVVQTQLMHDLLIAVKVSMMLVQKLPENIQGSLWKHHESFVWQSMCSLLKSSTNLLMDGKFSNIQTKIFLLHQFCCLRSKCSLYI